jgi:hypothetical protein
MTETEKQRLKAGIPKETIAVYTVFAFRERARVRTRESPPNWSVIDRIWNKRPDGFAIKMPTTTKAGEFVILELKRMSCVTDQYVTRAKNVAVGTYTTTWLTSRSRTTETDIECIRSKLGFKMFDEFANILKGMYSTRFNGRPTNNGDHDQMDTTPNGPLPPLINSFQACQATNIRHQKEKEKKGVV